MSAVQSPYLISVHERIARRQALPSRLSLAVFDLVAAQAELYDAQNIARVQARDNGYGLREATGGDYKLVGQIKARKRALALSAFAYAARALALLGLACPNKITLQNNEAGPGSGVTQSRPFPARAVKGLVSGASRHNLSLAALSVLNRWWIGELLNALLRPMFCRAREAGRNELAIASDRFDRLFIRLLDACDCYPYLVIADRCGLWILQGQSADDARAQIDEGDALASTWND